MQLVFFVSPLLRLRVRLESFFIVYMYNQRMSVEAFASQICSCLCVFMLFNIAKRKAYTLPFMVATFVLCIISTLQTIGIGYTAVDMVKTATGQKEEKKE